MGYDAENCSFKDSTLENIRHGDAVASARSGTQDSERLPSSIPSGQSAAADRRSSILWTLGLALLAFAVRASSIFAGFVFDDTFSIETRAGVDWSRIPGFFTTDQSSFFGANFYRPVLNVYYEVVYGLCGTHAAAWHLTSILLHVACTLLVFRLALRLVENRFAAWLAAALFAIHPAQVEAISWASAMGDPLMTLFMLLAVLAFLRWMEQGTPAWWAASFAAGTACVFTKETAVVLPVVLLVTALGLRSRAKSGLPVLAATVPFFAITLVFLGLRQAILRHFSHALTPASTAQMIFTWPSALLFYLRHMFWPSVVVPFYPLHIVTTWNSQEFWMPLLGLIAVSGVLGYLLWKSAGWQKSAVCLVWILAPLAPALYLKALAPFELVHDRFLYAPLVGFCMAAALILQWAAQGIEAGGQWRVLPLVALALIPLLSLETMSQMVWWQNNKTLFTRALSVTPENPKALVCLAAAYMAEQRYDHAAPLMQRALELAPQDSNALFGTARLAWLRGDNVAAEKYLTQALSSNPRYDMWLHLVSVELRLNHLDAAQEAARQSAAMNPTGAGVHVAMGTVLLAKGDSAGAAREFRDELRVFPQSEPAIAGLALATGNPR
jgi:tetratricopeptide (TPR) repeat protein